MDNTPLWFDGLYDRLLRADLQDQLPGFPDQTEETNLSESEIRMLLGAASAISLSRDESSRSVAYEVASRLVELFADHFPGIVNASDIIFSRVGNFPGRKLLRNSFSQEPGREPRAPPRLAIERLAREIENTVPALGDTPVALTDFQFELLKALSERKSISVSAPTSAGKSFVLSLDLVRRVGLGQQAIVYLVPTRALIREVSLMVRTSLRAAALDGTSVRTVPFAVSKTDAPHGVVYVLTQERLMTLLSTSPEAWVTTLIVDEAHNVQDDSRGVILQAAIERVVKRFPEAEIHFASPLSKNPEMLLGIVGRQTDGGHIVERQSPVSQNLILVSPVPRKSDRARFSLISKEGDIALGVRKLPFSMRGNAAEQKARFARSITKDDEATIVFANDAHSAELVAKHLCDSATDLATTTQGVDELIDYIAREMHPQYPLIRCLRHGVAYHYGHMPSLVRGRIEDLFKSGEIRFICCTSTLLQGVNLPARHIVIENPKRGRSGPMPRRDFLNLAGRAGRLLREFHGNVWCLRPEQWEEPVFRGEALIEITSAVDDAMRDGGAIIGKAVDGTGSEKNREYGEAVLGKLYLDYLASGSTATLERWATPANEAAIRKTEELIKSIKVTLPESILESNPGVRPDRLQALFDFFQRSQELSKFLPLNPWTRGYYDRMKGTIRVLHLVFQDKDDRSHEYLAWLASRWIHDTPLAELVASAIKDATEPDEISGAIRSLLKTLETDIRYKLVKHYAAYISVLKFALESRGEKNLAQQVEPFHVYLECGASHATSLNLIALGLSRATALAASRALRLPAGSTPEDCLAYIARADIARFDMPDLCKRELRELVGAD